MAISFPGGRSFACFTLSAPAWNIVRTSHLTEGCSDLKRSSFECHPPWLVLVAPLSLARKLRKCSISSCLWCSNPSRSILKIGTENSLLSVIFPAINVPLSPTSRYQSVFIGFGYPTTSKCLIQRLFVAIVQNLDSFYVSLGFFERRDAVIALYRSRSGVICSCR